MDSTPQERVVKCRSCDKYYGYIVEEGTKCPFCRAIYTEDKDESRVKKITVKTESKKKENEKPPKESFKIWNKD